MHIIDQYIGTNDRSIMITEITMSVLTIILYDGTKWHFITGEFDYFCLLDNFYINYVQLLSGISDLYLSTVWF